MPQKRPPSSALSKITVTGHLLKAQEQGDVGIVEAVYSVMGVLDYGDDIVHPGAFIKTLAERREDIRILDNHRTGSVTDAVAILLEAEEIGRAQLPPEVQAKYPEATGGLWAKTQYLLDDPSSRAVFTRIKNNVINQYSFAYDILQFDYSEITDRTGQKRRVRNLRQLRLWDLSPVLWGMNMATFTEDAKNTLPGTTQPDEQKEMTAQGAVVRLGDYIVAGVASSVDGIINNLLRSGKVSSDEWSILRNSVSGAIGSIKEAIGSDLRERSMGGGLYTYYYEDALHPDNLVQKLNDAAQRLETAIGHVDSEQPGKGSTNLGAGPDTPSTPIDDEEAALADRVKQLEQAAQALEFDLKKAQLLQGV